MANNILGYTMVCSSYVEEKTRYQLHLYCYINLLYKIAIYCDSLKRLNQC